MTVVEMIFEGAINWTNDVMLSPIVFAIVFSLGFAVMAFMVRVFTFSAINYGLAKSQNTTNHVLPDDMAKHKSAFERKILQTAPFPIWSKNPDGSVIYANYQYNEQLAEVKTNHINFSNTTTDSGYRLAVSDNAETDWYSVSNTTIGDQTIEFALPANDLVKAENSMKRFMETLSTTFAHLSAGMAIFDSDKTLNLFNPALSTILNLDPTWLAMRPTISEFLEKLRDNQHLPEQKNFLEWRRLITTMEESNRDSQYQDQWVLPGGKVLRVSGRPHPQGAIAFLFEDISEQIASERKHIIETTVNQTVLDHLSQGVVIFNSAGNISLSNEAFDSLYEIQTSQSPEIISVSRLSELCPINQNVFWGRLRWFISQPENRKPWEELLRNNSGYEHMVNVSPMPDGSTLVIFSTNVANQGQMGDEQQSDIEKPTTKLRHSYEEASMIHDPVNLAGIEKILAERNISFNTSAFSLELPDHLDPAMTRKIIWYLILATSDMCKDAGTLSMTTNNNGQRLSVSCHMDDSDIASNFGSHLSLNLLRQLVSTVENSTNWIINERSTEIEISCELPIRTFSSPALVSIANI